VEIVSIYFWTCTNRGSLKGPTLGSFIRDLRGPSHALCVVWRQAATTLQFMIATRQGRYNRKHYSALLLSRNMTNQSSRFAGIKAAMVFSAHPVLGAASPSVISKELSD
jgi:hypothetical protein